MNIITMNRSREIICSGSKAINGKTYNIIWCDEFDKTTLDTSKWTNYNCHPKYSPSCTLPSNVSISNSILKMKITKRTPNYTCVPCGTGVLAGNSPYAGVKLDTKGKYNIPPPTATGGIYIETKMRLPISKGLTGGFWLRYSSGNINREIDAPEWRASQRNMLKRQKALYFTNIWSYNPLSEVGINITPTFDVRQWHTYGTLWTKDTLQFTMDGKTFSVDGYPSTFYGHSPEYPMYLLLTSGAGDFDDPDSTTIFPSSIDVDYVRVYKI